jgi:hypothetical protein
MIKLAKTPRKLRSLLKAAALGAGAALLLLGGSPVRGAALYSGAPASGSYDAGDYADVDAAGAGRLLNFAGDGVSGVWWPYGIDGNRLVINCGSGIAPLFIFAVDTKGMSPAAGQAIGKQIGAGTRLAIGIGREAGGGLGAFRARRILPKDDVTLWLAKGALRMGRIIRGVPGVWIVF